MNRVESTYAVLLKPALGYTEKAIDGNQLKPVAAQKGSLLAYLDSLTVNRIQERYHCLVNYKVADRHDSHQPEVFLFVTGPSSVLHITALQRDFLLSVKLNNCRMEVLKRLKWVESLELGSEVYVTIATIPTPVRGIIRYIGGLHSEEGRQFGIELMVCIC